MNGPLAWGHRLTIDWDLTDSGERYRMTLSNGALTHWPRPADAEAGGTGPDLTLTLTRPLLLGLLAGHGLDGVTADGDMAALQRLLSVLDQPDPGFAIVTP